MKNQEIINHLNKYSFIYIYRGSRGLQANSITSILPEEIITKKSLLGIRYSKLGGEFKLISEMDLEEFEDLFVVNNECFIHKLIVDSNFNRTEVSRSKYSNQIPLQSQKVKSKKRELVHNTIYENSSWDYLYYERDNKGYFCKMTQILHMMFTRGVKIEDALNRYSIEVTTKMPSLYESSVSKFTEEHIDIIHKKYTEQLERN